MFQFLSVLPFRSMIRSGDLDPSSSNWFCSLSYLWDLMLYAWLTNYVLTPKYIYTQYLHLTVVFGITANYFIKTFDAFVRWYHFKTQMFRSRSVQRSGWAEHCSVSSHPRHLLVHFWHCTALLWITLHCLALVVCCRPPHGQFQLPDALKDAHLRHPRDSISLSPRLSGCLQGRCSDWKIGSWILLFLRSPSGLFLPPSSCLSTWTPAAYRWAFGTARWGCAGSVGTCTGTSLCCWELPTRCRCCRRADSRSVLHKIVTIWRRGGELCKWNELGLVSCCKHKCKHIIIYTK